MQRGMTSSTWVFKASKYICTAGLQCNISQELPPQELSEAGSLTKKAFRCCSEKTQNYIIVSMGVLGLERLWCRDPPMWNPSADGYQAQQVFATNRGSLGWRVTIKRQNKYLCAQPPWKIGTSWSRQDKEAAQKNKCKWISFWREAAMARTQWLALNSSFKSRKTCWRAKSQMSNPVKWAHSRSNF